MSSSKHHKRTHSWPPSFHLIDVLSIHLPLPDIDENPFVHFLSRAPEDEEEPGEDLLALSVGMVTGSSSNTSTTAKAYKFRTSIARKWARYIAKHYPLHLHHDSDSSGQQVLKSTKDGDSKSTSLTRITAGKSKQESNPANIHSLLVIPSSPGYTKKHPRVYGRYRHSWHQPSWNLFTIEEETSQQIETDERNKPLDLFIQDKKDRAKL